MYIDIIFTSFYFLIGKKVKFINYLKNLENLFLRIHNQKFGKLLRSIVVKDNQVDACRSCTRNIVRNFKLFVSWIVPAAIPFIISS